MKASARAYANFALIKYWGKKDENLKLPFQSSLSFTVDAFYTDVKICFDKDLKQDQLLINQEEIFDHKYQRIKSYMDLARIKYDIKMYARIETFSHGAIGAGLASSSSLFAALAKAIDVALDLKLSPEALSILARLGSGSAARSVHGGFSVWQKGNDQTSFAKKMKVDFSDFRMIACIVDETIKPISSTDAMKKSLQSPYYKAYVKQSEFDLKNMKQAIKNKDIDAIGQIAEANALLMHATLLPLDLWYFKPETIYIMDEVKKLREKGVKVYFTIDAGPNIKLITTDAYVKAIRNHFKAIQTIELKEGKPVYGKRID